MSMDTFAVVFLVGTVVVLGIVFYLDTRSFSKKVDNQVEAWKTATLTHRPNCITPANAWYQVSDSGIIYSVKLCEDCKIWGRVPYQYKDTFTEVRR